MHTINIIALKRHKKAFQSSAVHCSGVLKITTFLKYFPTTASTEHRQGNQLRHSLQRLQEDEEEEEKGPKLELAS